MSQTPVEIVEIVEVKVVTVIDYIIGLDKKQLRKVWGQIDTRNRNKIDVEQELKKLLMTLVESYIKMKNGENDTHRYTDCHYTPLPAPTLGDDDSKPRPEQAPAVGFDFSTNYASPEMNELEMVMDHMRIQQMSGKVAISAIFEDFQGILKKHDVFEKGHISKGFYMKNFKKYFVEIKENKYE